MKKSEGKKANAPLTEEQERLTQFLGLMCIWAISVTVGIFDAMRIYDFFLNYGVMEAMYRAIGTFCLDQVMSAAESIPFVTELVVEGWHK